MISQLQKYEEKLGMKAKYLKLAFEGGHKQSLKLSRSVLVFGIGERGLVVVHIVIPSH